MRSIDTNIIARWVMRDDPVQARIADEIMDQPIEITQTVLLEIAWVLTSVGKMSRGQFADAMQALLLINNATIPGRNRIAWAIDRYRAGADWADVIHLSTTAHATSFATFDRSLKKDAGASTPVPVEILGN